MLRLVVVRVASGLRLLLLREVLLSLLTLFSVVLPLREEELLRTVEAASSVREETVPVRAVVVPWLLSSRVEVLLERLLVEPVLLPEREVLLPERDVVPRLREFELSPLRVVALLLRVSLSLLRLEMLFPRVPLPSSDSLRLGALVVVRLPVTRSVDVMVLLLRSLVMRLPLRPVGLFCTVVAERGAVTRPTRGRSLYWYPS